MQRFAYTPRAEAFIKLQDGTVIDVTSDIISGDVTRRLNAMSTATLQLQNKHGRYVQKYRIHPMDRIIIRLGRIGPSVLVFSGYVDEAPYYQLYPGPVTIRCSDTLKLLQYTYFDPGLPALEAFFAKYGWTYDPASGMLSLETSPDHATAGNFDLGKGIGEVIYAVLTDRELGNWPADAIKILSLPPDFVRSIARIYNANLSQNLADYDALERRLEKMLSIDPTNDPTQNQGNANNSVSGDTVATGNIAPLEAARIIIQAGFSGKDIHGQEAPVVALAIAQAESSLRTDASNFNSNGSWDLGLFQINTVHSGCGQTSGLASEISQLDACNAQFAQQMFDPIKNAQIALALYNGKGRDWTDWVTYNNHLHEPYLASSQQAIQAAAAGLGGTTTPGSGKQDVAQDTGPIKRDNNVTGSAVANKLISLVLGEAAKGIHESGGENHGPEILKYQQVTGATGAPWCASFVQWALLNAGKPILNETNRTAAVAGILSVARRRGWLVQKPRPGDLITFNVIDTNPMNDHIGVVITDPVKHADNTIHVETVEGNYSDGVNKVDRQLANDQIYIRVPGVGIGNPAKVGSPQAAPGDPTNQITDDQIARIAEQAAWFTIQFQGNDLATSMSLTGKRALANDIPLLEWITSIIPGSGRVFTTAPDGSFWAFYPDYFGYFGRTPYFRIADIEITDFTIQRNDRELVTHVFATGPRFSNQISMLDRASSMVASVEEDAFNYFINVNSTNPLDAEIKNFNAIQFMQRYGARPLNKDFADVRNPLLLWMAAWMEFTKQWAKQYQANASFTFLPELYPGGLVAIGDRVTMFIEEVTHNFDLSSGFQTTAQLVAPSSKTLGGLPRSSTDQFPDDPEITSDPVDFFRNMPNG